MPEDAPATRTEAEEPAEGALVLGPSGHRRRRRRTLWHRASRAVRRALGRALMAIAIAAIPRIYMAYMWFVWKTSRIEDRGAKRAHAIRDENDGVVCVLWHEEVFSVAWAYREWAPHTLASIGDAGEIVAKLLRLCGYTVFRGGSGSKSRKREDVLAAMIDHMKKTPRVLYGITVDGSNGPRYKLKRGAIAIAKECRKPVLCVRTWAKRNLHLPTWDRMAIPLPFNVIHQYARGPFFVPENAGDPAVFEAFRQKIEDALCALRDESLADFGRPPYRSPS
jgi:lysophospholipid acyltransferase (LPLAT)-like uncharacterized protein